MNKLAPTCGSDKFMKMGIRIRPITKFTLKNRRFKRNIVLEIRVGGAQKQLKDGHSLRLCKIYFSFFKIKDIDLYDKKVLNKRRIRRFKEHQSDVNFFQSVIDEIGKPDIIIDDGSHINKYAINTFSCLFTREKIIIHQI